MYVYNFLHTRIHNIHMYVDMYYMYVMCATAFDFASNLIAGRTITV